eukprot:838213-Pyramimonas_sp.AAC.1
MEATRIDLQKEINEFLSPQADDLLRMRNSTMQVTAGVLFQQLCIAYAKQRSAEAQLNGAPPSRSR